MAKIKQFDSKNGMLNELEKATEEVVFKLPFSAIGFKSTKNPFEKVKKVKVKHKDGKDFKHVKLTK